MSEEVGVETIVTAPADWNCPEAIDFGPSLAVQGMRRYRITGNSVADVIDDPRVRAIGLHKNGMSPLRPLLDEALQGIV